MKKKVFSYLFILILLLGLAVRLFRLDLRPMHHDEANQAYKFGLLLEKGEYRYDPSDHHGPTLYYFSLPFAWLSGQKTYADLAENTLRGVAAFFGVFTILLLLATGKYLTVAEKSWAAVFLAIAAPVIYFNRFYIQETMFVAFGLAFVFCLWRFIQKPDFREAVWLGLTAGLLYATKETSLIVFGSAALALVLIWFWSRLKNRKRRGERTRTLRQADLKAMIKAFWPVLTAVLVFLAVSFIFYSSFLRYPQGLMESYRSLAGYTHKALEAGWHQHGFWYYFSLLFFHKEGPNSPVFSEIPFLALALYGLVLSLAGFSRKAAENFRPYLALFALVTALVYSAIPYKTPWNLLIFYAIFLVLAGVGFARLLALIKIRQARIILAGALLLWTGWQSYLVNIYFHSFPANPYVYAQTLPDFMRLVSRVEELASVSKDGREMLMKVIAPPEETWPLPWYLRRFTQVGYWTASEQVEALEPAEIVIMSAGEAGKRAGTELDSYYTQYFSLRPDVLLTLCVREDLWENYRLRKSASPPVR